MTPLRKKHLQWFHDRGEVPFSEAQESLDLSIHMIRRMLSEDQLDAYTVRVAGKAVYHYALTDLGRQALHEN